MNIFEHHQITLHIGKNKVSIYQRPISNNKTINEVCINNDYDNIKDYHTLDLIDFLNKLKNTTEIYKNIKVKNDK
jgi:hypothetical protein